jgi:hypothetical protein
MAAKKNLGAVAFVTFSIGFSDNTTLALQRKFQNKLLKYSDTQIISVYGIYRNCLIQLTILLMKHLTA